MQNESSLGPAGHFSDAPTGGQPVSTGGPANGTAAQGASNGGQNGQPQGQPRAPRPRRATARFMLSHPLHILSLGFGSGLSPIAPGTVGTLFAWASFAAFSAKLTVIEWGILIAVGFVAGIGICGFTADRLGIDDPSPVVWDEIVAFWLVLVMVTPASFTGQLWAFIVFRFFDMVKPPPIRYFDRRLKGGFGIMFDDLVAAFFTLLVIALWRMSV
ncbi:phosphatidylglycerophosphatase A [Paraburkholderia sp. C35]|uniref:phosphatidylglycerophosphatase A family protein n=1 Tax=Paraburkholderia sp. C35 TaxID=2126993 RepID=UPI001EF4705F|nr:phosphatidylglycerophosphatase A [Paraburkholderia sp. C35]